MYIILKHLNKVMRNNFSSVDCQYFALLDDDETEDQKHDAPHGCEQAHQHSLDNGLVQGTSSSVEPVTNTFSISL